MPSTRPCRYCLGMQNDSVFADFDLNSAGDVVLSAISFDGYGCCLTKGKVQTMSHDVSQRFISLVESNDLNSGELASILAGFFSENTGVIWRDALKDHDLLPT